MCDPTMLMRDLLMQLMIIWLMLVHSGQCAETAAPLVIPPMTHDIKRVEMSRRVVTSGLLKGCIVVKGWMDVFTLF